MASRQLATNVTDFASGALGLVELAASYLQDRLHKAWSKSELIVYANEAQDEIAEAINSFYETFFINSATTPTVSGQSVYALPPDMVELIDMEVVDNVSTDTDPQHMTEVLLHDRRFYEGMTAANSKREYGYFFIQNASFRLMPGAGSSDQFVRIYYVKRLDALVNDTDVSEIPAEHHELIAYKAVRRAMAKRERQNPVIETLHAERMAILEASVRRFSRFRVNTRRPWRGTFGPYRNAEGYRLFY